MLFRNILTEMLIYYRVKYIKLFSSWFRGLKSIISQIEMQNSSFELTTPSTWYMNRSQANFCNLRCMCSMYLIPFKNFSTDPTITFVVLTIHFLIHSSIYNYWGPRIPKEFLSTWWVWDEQKRKGLWSHDTCSAVNGFRVEAGK